MDSLPNIVHILYSGIGGEAGVVFPLAKAAATQSHQHAIFYGVEPVAPANVHQCKQNGIVCHSVQKQPGLDRRAQGEIVRILVDLNPVAVIVHTLGTLPACLKAKRQLPHLKIIAVEHHSNALKSAKRWLLSLAALWRADRVVYLTSAYRQQVAAKLRQLYHWRADRTCVIGNSLDLALYPRAELKVRSRFVVGMQGRMVAGKDFPTLLRAVAAANQGQATSLHLELLGDGPDRPAHEALAADLGICQHVTFCGMVSPSQLIAKMQRWHAYVHASLGETMSIAIMEAKALGLPIIATEAPGVTEFFQNGHNGLVVPKGDFQALACRLREIQANPVMGKCLGHTARMEAEANFSSHQAWLAYATQIAGQNVREPFTLESIQPASV